MRFATENYSVNMAGGVNVWLFSSSFFIILAGGWSDWTFYFVQMNKPPGDMWRRCQPCLYHRFRHFALPQDVWILRPLWVWTDEEVRQATDHFAALRALSELVWKRLSAMASQQWFRTRTTIQFSLFYQRWMGRRKVTGLNFCVFFCIPKIGSDGDHID